MVDCIRFCPILAILLPQLQTRNLELKTAVIGSCHFSGTMETNQSKP